MVNLLLDWEWWIFDPLIPMLEVILEKLMNFLNRPAVLFLWV
jgi:hypothetical protein